MKFFILGLMALVFTIPNADAAVPTKNPISPQIIQGTGVITGGAAGSTFSLLDIRKSQDLKMKAERLVIDVGDSSGKVVKGPPGYFHAQLLQNPARLVIDFSQMPASKMNVQEIKKRLGLSMYIKESKMSLDPVDQSLNMVFFLKNNPKVKIYPVNGKEATSKVVVDFL